MTNLPFYCKTLTARVSDLKLYWRYLHFSYAPDRKRPHSDSILKLSLKHSALSFRTFKRRFTWTPLYSIQTYSPYYDALCCPQLYYAALRCTLLYSTVLLCTLRYSSALRSTPLYSAILHSSPIRKLGASFYFYLSASSLALYQQF